MTLPTSPYKSTSIEASCASFQDASLQLHSYSSVAAEYYDAERHPTCRNFRDASYSFLVDVLHTVHGDDGWALEVGAGDSLLGTIGHSGRLILLDNSYEMLSYSNKFQHVADLIVGDALALPFLDGTISLTVASLADPYNVPRFWSEVSRILKSGSHCIFTTPSHEWASTFRRNTTNEHEDAAFFELTNGERVYLPSFIQTDAAQIEMMSRAGLRLVERKSIAADAVPEPHSAKITGCRNIVTGYVVQRV